MGLGSFFANLSSPRTKGNGSQRSYFEQRKPQPHDVSTTRPGRRYRSEPEVARDAVLTQAVPSAKDGSKRDNRKSLSGMVKQKSESNLKKRRSWFGGRPKEDENVPAVPLLPGSTDHMRNRHVTNDEEPARPGTALTTDDPIHWSRPSTPDENERKVEKRKSFFGRKRSQSSVSTARGSKRKSWFGGKAADDEAPPMPAVPVHASQHQPAAQTASIPQSELRRQSRMSMGRERSKSFNTASQTKTKRRRSWWASSNPDSEDERDEDEPPLPPMPALMADDGGFYTPDSSVTTTRSPDNSFAEPTVFADSPQRAFLAEDPVKMVTRGNSIKSPRPVSGVSLSSRRSYVPRNAKAGFLKSTSLNPNRMSGNRHSCLNDEQQLEWDKLKNLMEVLENRQDAASVRTVRDDERSEDDRDDGPGYLWPSKRDVHSNQDALAALELGVAR